MLECNRPKIWVIEIRQWFASEKNQKRKDLSVLWNEKKINKIKIKTLTVDIPDHSHNKIN